MKKLWAMSQDIILSWLPFVAALFMSRMTLSAIPAGDLRAWQPAFYGVLPLCFFFVGWAVFMNRREMRQLRGVVANLGLIHGGVGA